MATISTTALQDIMEQVRLNYPKLIRGWFSDLRLARLDSGVVHVLASNSAQVRYLQQNCYRAFCEAAQAATGRLVSVQFESDTEENGNALARWPFGEPAWTLPLNSDFTFEHFVTGPCNRLAHAASVAVAGAPGRAYNPLFMHGAVGLGKTHLLQATCHQIRNHNPGTVCLYISCEAFINDLIEAVEHGAIHDFRYRYRCADVLVIDDIQFLSKQERTQEELFHTFNTLHQSQRQVILAADCPPVEIPSLEQRLISRFNSGLVAGLDPPCLETRMAIVRKKARLRCIEVPEDVVRFIAGRVESNIRDLEGALLRVDALSQTRSGVINLDTAYAALGAGPARPIRIPTILEIVARRFHVKITDLQGKKRSKTFTRPRHVCMYLARQLTAHSLEDIGGYFGGRDHTTVLHASRTIGQLAGSDPHMRQMLDELTTEVKNAS